MWQEFILEARDDTYIFGDLTFKADFNEEQQIFNEPYIREDGETMINYYPSKKLFVIYYDNVIVKIIFTSTCWSDDFIEYYICDNVAFSCNENYHGRPRKINHRCNIDMSEFITTNNL